MTNETDTTNNPDLDMEFFEASFLQRKIMEDFTNEAVELNNRLIASSANDRKHISILEGLITTLFNSSSALLYPSDLEMIINIAKSMAAKKMGLKKDYLGTNLPSDLWMQCLSVAMDEYDPKISETFTLEQIIFLINIVNRKKKQ